MAALPLASLRPAASLSRFIPSSILAARPAWSIPCQPSSSKSPLPAPLDLAVVPAPAPASASPAALYAATLSTPWYAPAIPLLDALAELFPPLLWAVPKHKVSHSRKGMRAANKGLKNKTNFSQCEACGQIKLAHNVCPSCYSQISRRWKREGRGEMIEGSRSDSRSAPGL